MIQINEWLEKLWLADALQSPLANAYRFAMRQFA
jgi:hypothetical protein